MAGGAFTNGPIVEPKVEVIQNFITTNPLVVAADLPICVVGQHRQIQFEELLGTFDAPAADVDYPVARLTTYSATLVELDPITYVDENGDTQQSPSLPLVVFRHPTFGDATIPKNAVGTPGWTFDQVSGELTVDKDFEATYEIASGVGSYTVYEESDNVTPAINTNSGYREFTDADADFIGDGVEAGDRVLTADTNFSVIQVVNETTLIVQDEQFSGTPPTGFADDVAYTIEKVVNDGGSIYISYVANRGDLKTSLLTIDENNFDSVMGSDNWLNPLGYYVNRALQNTGRQVLAMQVEDADSQTSWEDALDALSNFEQPYGLVPLTQDEAILALFITHVNDMSTAANGKERRLLAAYPLNITTERAQSGTPFLAFGTGGGDSNRSAAGTATIRVTAGNNNIHMRGVVQGDVFRDLTPGFEGEARIISVTPASPAADADVALVLATPNTWGLFGTQAHDSLNLSSAAAQVVGCEFDVEATVAGNTVAITLDGTVHTFTAAAVPAAVDEFLAGAGGNASLFAKLTAYFGARLDITHPGGGANPVEVRETLGGFGTVLGPAVAATGAATVEDVGGGGAVVTMVATGITAGVKANDTFTIDDDTIPVTTFTFKNDQTTVNGSLLAANNYAVQIGGPVMSALNICERVAAAINAAGLDVTAEVDTTLVDVVVTSKHTGVLGGVIITAVTAPITIVNVTAGTGATNGSPITDWEITTKALTVDEQATAVAQKSRDLYNRRVINTWPDICDERFSDETAGTQLAQQGKGIFSGRTGIVQSVPNYSDAVAIAAFRSTGLAATPATKRQMVGPYLLRRVSDTYSKAQLDRILSTGTTLFEQLVQPGGTVDPVRAVTTDTTDLKFVEENVNAAVDKFAKTLRNALRGVFGPNLLDPDGNFLEMVSTKVQGVIDEFTRPGNREARAIKIISFRESETVKDRVEMDILYTPLFGANSGQFTIYV